jgi:ubiquinone biosynthesis protein COQ4
MLEKARLALAAYRLYREPSRLENFFQMVEAAKPLAGADDVDRVAGVLCEASPAFATAVRDRYVIRHDLGDLARRPRGSLGRAVYEHCTKWKIDPATFPPRPNRTRAEYLLVHIENTHDVWHPVCGFESDLLGEIGLQAFYLAQFPNLIGLLLMAIANVHALGDGRAEYPRLMEEITRGWLLGKRATSLFGVRWDAHWDRPLAQVQRELRIDPAGVGAIVRQGTEEMERRLAMVA